MSEWSIGPDLIGNIGFSSNTLTANRAYFYPFIAQEPITIAQLGWYNGLSVSGNCDAGVYDLAGNRLISTGSTAQASTSSLQIVNVTDTPITRGYHFLAFVIDNGTGNMFCEKSNPEVGVYKACGIMQMDSAFPLPSVATFAKMAGQVLLGVFAARKATV